MAPISHFLHSGGGEKYRAEQLQCKVRVENATVGRGNGNQMRDTGESFTADACCGRSKYVRVLILTRRMGKREELSSAKAEKLKRGGVPRRDKKSSVCYEHSEGHLETEEARDKGQGTPASHTGSQDSRRICSLCHTI